MRVTHLLTGLTLVFGILFLGFVASRSPQSRALAAPPAKQPDVAPPTLETAPPKKLETKSLPNAYRIHSKVISGGLPDGEAGFAELKSLGIRTVISVDGAKPDVELAHKYGLRYVHLPHGYDGVPDERGQELAKAVRELVGPIYVHCHHGKHRSPAAAVVACVEAGMIPAESAKSVLVTAGTSENYRGLYQSAENARPLDAATLDALQVKFVEVAPIPPFAQAMVNLEHTHDHLKQLAANKWQRLADQPALDPAHEALLLREHFTEMLRVEDVAQRPERFRQMLNESEADSLSLELVLSGADRDSATGEPQTKADAALAKVTANCKACHTTFRDVPLSEKAKQAK